MKLPPPVVSVPLGFVIIVFLVAFLVADYSPEKHMSADRNMCARRAGFILLQPLGTFHAPDTANYWAYTVCMTRLGYDPVPALPQRSPVQ
jgi:hypothetical protein